MSKTRDKKKKARQRRVRNIANRQRNNGYQHRSPPGHLGRVNTAQDK